LGLQKKFGKDIYIKGVLDKKKLASYIFHNEDDLTYVNSLIHPVVKDHFNKWLTKQKGKFVIKETAILFETGIYKNVDIIISVLASKELRIKRIMKRDQLNSEEIKARINKQI
jgi:dephospho-CoA kinase